MSAEYVTANCVTPWLSYLFRSPGNTAKEFAAMEEKKEL